MGRELLSESPEKNTIVCVDDEERILQAIERLLRKEPYELLITKNPEEALEWVDNRQISLIITDQRMPSMKGSELLKAVKEKSPSTIRMILSGYTDTNSIIEAVNQGKIDCFLSKPWDEDSLKDAIRKMLLDRDKELGERFPRVDRLQVRVDCKGKTSEDVLDEVIPMLKRREFKEAEWVLVLENLNLLEGSLTKFLKVLYKRIRDLGVKINVEDKAGYISAFLEVINLAVKLS